MAYKRRELAQLAHQLKLSPHRLKPVQIAGAARMLRLIRPGKCYPYDLVCYHVTGYRTKKAARASGIPADELAGDLVQLIDDLSRSAPLRPHEYGEPVHTLPELARRLNVSAKTIGRWRRRGLICRRVATCGAKVQLAVVESDLRRFVHGHLEVVQRAAAFRQLDEGEKSAIVEQARELLAERRMRLHEVAQALSASTGRAVETIRYTLRRYDAENPATAIFGGGGQPVVHPEHQTIFSLYEKGAAIESLASRFDRSPETIRSIIREMRCRRLMNRPIEYVYNAEFDAPNADRWILGEPPLATGSGTPEAVSDVAGVPAYLRELFSQPVLTREQEAALFRRFNYLKYKARRLRDALDPLASTDAQIAEVESVFAQADADQDELIRCNLRLVVSIAKRHVRSGPDFFDAVSDGNLALMRAVQKFDYSRGNKFSTYATWAVMRYYARAIPAEHYRSIRYQTGSEEVLAAAADPAVPALGDLDQRRSLRETLAAALTSLDHRERAVVVRHFGLDEAGQHETLEQIGKVIGVTKERVRQIEHKALAKLREVLPPAVQEMIN